MALDWNFPGGGFGSVIRLVIFFSFSFLFFVLIVFFYFFLLSLFDSIRPAVYILALKQLMLYFSSHPFPKFSLSLSLVLWACYLFILFYSVFIFCVSLFLSFFGVPRFSDLLVLETPPGQRAERFSAPL